MKTTRFKLLGVGVVAICVFLSSGTSAQQAPGDCTNYGCIKIQWMAHIMSNYQPGCSFLEFPTGRRVRNTQGIQGGTPVLEDLPDQIVWYNYSSCAVCNPPPGLNTMAIEGSGQINNGNSAVGITTFRRWRCSTDDLNPGGGGGGVQ